MKDYILFFNYKQPEVLRQYLKKHRIKYGRWFESIISGQKCETRGGTLVEAVRIVNNIVDGYASRNWYLQNFRDWEFVILDTRIFVGEL